jgi:hypothetical protein
MNIICNSIQLCYEPYPKRCKDFTSECESCTSYGYNVVGNFKSDNYYYIKKNMFSVLFTFTNQGLTIESTLETI